MEVTIDDAERVRTIDKVPESGQVSIGKDLAGKRVKIAVEVLDDDE